jgi:hypothetical protein
VSPKTGVEHDKENKSLSGLCFRALTALYMRIFRYGSVQVQFKENGVCQGQKRRRISLLESLILPFPASFSSGKKSNSHIISEQRRNLTKK